MTAPSAPRFDDRVYYDARQALAHATRTNATRCIARTQQVVAAHLHREKADEALVRLARGDLAETLLARRALEVARHEAYAMCRTVEERDEVLQLALAEALFTWVATRAGSQLQRALTSAAGMAYFENQCGH